MRGKQHVKWKRKQGAERARRKRYKPDTAREGDAMRGMRINEAQAGTRQRSLNQNDQIRAA
mgnify:CR=1 FL=1